MIKTIQIAAREPPNLRKCLMIGGVSACLLIASTAQAQVITFGYTGSASTLTITSAGIYEITVAGAQGGNGGNSKQGGAGAIIIGDYSFAAGDVLNLIVGGQGGSSTYSGGGGGGGSFVFDTSTATLVVVAGGGGGAGSHGGGGTGGQITTFGSSGNGAGAGAGGANGNGGQANPNDHGGGGGGFLTSGQDSSSATGGGAYPSLAGGVNIWGEPGGYGGGGAGSSEGGGGGGYSGGGGGSGYNSYGGGGGGSFDAAGFTLASATAGAAGNAASMTGNLGNGFISFTLIQLLLSPISAGSASLASSLGVSVLPSFQGGTLTMNQAGTYSQNFTLANSGANKIDQDGHNSTFTGNFTDATTGGALIIANTGSGGSVTFSGVNTYTGATDILSGARLVAGSSGAFSVSSAFTVAASGTLDLGGYDTSIGSLSGAGVVTNSGSANATLTVRGLNTPTTFSGVIGDGANHTTGLTAAGGGLILSGANTYTGATHVNAGSLTLSGGIGQLHSLSGPVSVLAGASMTVTSAGSLYAAGVANAGAFANSGAVHGDLSNSGALTNQGTWIGTGDNAGGAIDNQATWTGAIVNTSGTFANEGTVSAGVTNSGTFNNNLGGQIAGGLANTAGTFTNASGATLDSATVSGGTLYNAGTVAGAANLAGGGQVRNAGVVGAVTQSGGTFINLAGGSTGAFTENGASALAYSFGTVASLQVASGSFANYATISGDVANNGAFSAANVTNGSIGGAIANNGGATFSVLGTLAVAGDFTNANGATLHVYAGGAYTAASSSTIGNSGAITVDNGGRLTANGGVTNNASGAITVAEGGIFTDDLNNAGAVTNNGVYNANVASNTGTITNNATWNGSITNSGALTSAGLITGGVTNTGAVNAAGAIGGPIVNNAGTFNVTGTLADGGSFSNASGATVAIGSNALSTTRLNNAGRVTAANGAIAGDVANIGALDISSSASNRLSVIGALSFAAGSAYQISVTPASASLTNVHGATTLSGGAVSALGGGTSSANYTRYAILTATGGVSGVFAGVTTNVSFLTPSLAYDANDVYLIMVRNDVNYASMANTPNQAGVANALARGQAATKGLNPVLTSVDLVSNTPANMPAVLDQLSGAGLAGAENLAFQAGALFTSTLSDQNRSWLSGGKGANEITLGRPNGLMANAPAPNRPPGDAVLGAQRTWRAWSGGYAGGATYGDDRSAGAYAQTNETYGGALGVDYQIQPGLLLGFAGGYSDGSFGVRRLGTSGHLEGGQFGFYGAATSGSLYGFASTAFSSFNNLTTRYVLAFGNLSSEKNNARFNSRELREHLEFGRRYVIGGATLTPYVKVDLATLWSDGFVENDGAGGTNMAGLSVANRQTLSAPGSVGVRLEQAFALGGMKIIPWGELAYVHEFSPRREIYGTFVNLPSATFGVNAARVGRDGAQVKAGARLALTERSCIFASFDGDFSGKSEFYAGKGGVQVNW
ncbi:uncharacterized protein with beta-barrel porin domain [Rhodoblastus acidophilus]|uniref:autotransporter domain-containing protein n=1 Tax=Rhodoblastus acidophilus TaxID=1074 RepID=UPI0022255B9F|nr:autotransporter domain-containing protein [Rhodoblastus acidophilus]MCW2315498.1 uncharacterized protein with beta-barrel porin domain [Rhodoblastus acidophilus]